MEKCDFITSPGFLTGAGAREAAGLRKGGPPIKIVTDLAVIGFDDKVEAMTVEYLRPAWIWKRSRPRRASVAAFQRNR